ncbi:MAG: retropepsin-like aspartic protease family protein [Alphaproteobacteria bacterium]
MDRRPRGKFGNWPGWLGLAAFAIATFSLVIYLARRDDGGGVDGGDNARLVYLVLLLIMVGSSVIVRRRARPALLLRHLTVWGAIGFALVAGYGYRFEMQDLWRRVLGELNPGSGFETAGGEINFRAAADGQFRIRATVDGTKVRFLFDTGASRVVLSPSDAERIGFDLSRLSFSQRFHTANGTGMGAPVRLRELRIGPIVQRNVAASVNRAEMDTSLLGMNFLRRLSRYEVRNGTLTLRR